MSVLKTVRRKLSPLEFRLRVLYCYLRYGRMGRYLAFAYRVPGWTKHSEAVALAQASYSLPANAVVVEIGSFLGKSSVLLAGARKLRGSGTVHCVDPFDSSGDAFSIPYYKAIESDTGNSLRDRFNAHMRDAGVENFVQVHQGTAESASDSWTEPIDMLFLDGDQSPAGARSAYEHWARFLKAGGVIALHNSSERKYAPGHDGHHLLVVETVRPPAYEDVVCVSTTTFARKAAASPAP
jgi:hypothetical protein